MLRLILNPHRLLKFYVKFSTLPLPVVITVRPKGELLFLPKIANSAKNWQSRSSKVLKGVFIFSPTFSAVCPTPSLSYIFFMISSFYLLIWLYYVFAFSWFTNLYWCLLLAYKYSTPLNYLIYSGLSQPFHVDLPYGSSHVFM